MKRTSRRHGKRTHRRQSRDTGPRQCRAYSARTISFVRRALDSWSYVYGLPSVAFQPEFGSCMELSKAVKTLLSSCPTSDPVPVMAFQSIKKGLPDSCKCMEPALLKGLVDNIVDGQKPSLPRGYLSFVKNVVGKMFPKAWDTDYEGYCRRAAPPLKATLSHCRTAGGALGDLSFASEGQKVAIPATLETEASERQIGHDMDQSDFLDITLNGSFHPFGALEGALQVVQSAGKPRPLTTFSSEGFFLKPLHKTIYNRLSRQKWLSRGDVTPATLRSAGFTQQLGGLLTSGDYASATDNLSIEVMEVALSAMLENSSCVPANIKEFALRACRPTLYESVKEYRAALEKSRVTGERINIEPLPPLRKGQMMGSLLSFPLLCLQNYLAFRWSTRREKGRIPVIINGDDILFQSSKRVSDSWMGCVSQLGLVVEPTKTSVSPAYGTLNSTLFEWKDGALELVPTLRFGMLRPSEYPNSLGRSFLDFVRGLPRDVRYRAGHVFFEFHLGELKSSAWSMPSLGFRGSLAHRLSRKFNLLDGQRLTGVPPPAPVTHSVCLPQDLITEVPNEFVTAELREMNSCETAAWKWQHGWRSADGVSSAIQYALSATRWTDDSDIVGHLVTALGGSQGEFDFKYGSRGHLSVSRPSLKDLANPFYEPFVKRETTRLFWRLAEESLYRASWFWGPLPTYEEAIGGVAAL